MIFPGAKIITYGRGKKNPFIVPLAIPLSGPAWSLASIMLYAKQDLDTL